MATVKGAWGEEYEVEEPVAETPVVPTPEISEEVNSEVTPPVVPEVPVETPAAAPISEEPPAAATPEVREVIKEVEKIVEKYPDMDEHSTQLFNAILEGKEDELLNYLNEKHKNFTTMSDYDVVKESLKRANPRWTPDEVELEIRYKYGEKLERIDLSTIDRDLEPDEYAKAQQHNRDVERNEVLLKRDARDGRIALEAGKKEVKFPKIQTEQPVQQPQQLSAEELEFKRQEWLNAVESEIPNVKEFSFKVGSKEDGYEDVTYQVSDAERAEQLAFMKELDFDKLVGRLGWLDKDGKQNVSKMAGDVLKLEGMQKLIQSAYIQGKTTGAKGTISEIKNLDLTGANASTVAATPPDIGAALFGHLNPR